MPNFFWRHGGRDRTLESGGPESESVFDVSSRAVPACGLTALVEQRVIADLEPSIIAIRAKHALFVLKGNATGECFVTFFSEPLDIFRMERAFPKIAGAHFIDRQPRILEHLLIHKDCRAASVQYDDVVRHQINDPLQLVFHFMERRVSGFVKVDGLQGHNRIWMVLSTPLPSREVNPATAL